MNPLNGWEMRAADARRRELAAAPVPIGALVIFVLILLLGYFL